MLALALWLVVGACPPQTFCNTTGPTATDALFGALVLAPDDAWAFGFKAALHWDGTSWLATKLPEYDRLDSAVALSPNDIWVTGNSSVLHWNGTAWRKVDRGQEYGYAGPVVEVRPGEVWVLGDPILRVDKGALVPLAADTAKGLAEPTLALDATTCGPNDLWLARRNSAQDLVLFHWDGKRVSRFPRSERADVVSLTCVDHVVWVTLEKATLACRDGACERVEAPAGAQVVKGTTGPWVVAREGLFRWSGKAFEKKGAAPGRWFGGAARGDDDVLLVGAVGATARFDGKQLTIPPRVTLGHVSDLSISREGEVWVTAETGLFVFRKGAWGQIKSFPSSPRFHGRVWADSGNHVWVIADERAWRWGGAKWADLTPRKLQIEDVWGRSETEVWLTTSEAVLAWNGKKFKSIATAPEDWSFGQIAGDAEHLAVMLRGPRPERTDGPPTGKPDRVLILEKGKQRIIDLPGRPAQLVWVGGQLWASSHGPVQRLVGEQWEPVGEATGECLVATAKGALIIGNGLGYEWDGTTMKRVEIPAGEFSVGAAVGSTVWLGGQDAVLRRD